MSRDDHYDTGSWGGSSDAQSFREAQKSLLDIGDYDGALNMGITDIRNQFGTKYDTHINSMLNKMPKLPNGKIDWSAYPRK
jgi:hypothetical protein